MELADQFLRSGDVPQCADGARPAYRNDVSLPPLLRFLADHVGNDSLVVADREKSLLISGTGDVIEPERPLLAIGSGGPYAQAAAQALLENTTLEARAIVEKSLSIAGEICIYTNRQIQIEEL